MQAQNELHSELLKGWFSGDSIGFVIRVIKGDTRSLDYRDQEGISTQFSEDQNGISTQFSADPSCESAQRCA